MKKRTWTARLFCLLAVLALCLSQVNVSLAAETKTSKRRRHLRQSTLVSSTQENTVKSMMPYKK